MKKIFILILLLSPLCIYSQNSKVSEDGFSILAGAGSMSGGLGIIAEYQIRLDMFTFLIPFAGSGVELGTKDLEGVWPGYALGANIEHGKYHRVLGGIIYGTRGVGFENKRGEITNQHVLVGPAAIIGYKRLSKSGLVFLVNVGMAYVRNPVAENKKYRSDPTAGIGIGYKL